MARPACFPPSAWSRGLDADSQVLHRRPAASVRSFIHPPTNSSNDMVIRAIQAGSNVSSGRAGKRRHSAAGIGSSPEAAKRMEPNLELRQPRRHRCDHVRSREPLLWLGFGAFQEYEASVLPLSQSQIEAQDEWELFSPSFMMTCEPDRDPACGPSLHVEGLAHPAGPARAEAGSAVSLCEVLGFSDVTRKVEPVKLRLTWSRPTCFLSSGSFFFFFFSDKTCCRLCEFVAYVERGRYSRCFFEQGRDRRTQWTGTISRGVHDRSAGRLALVPQSRRPCGQSPNSLLQGGNWTRKLGRRVRNLGGRQMHRHGSLPTTLSRARAGVRLQPASAATPQGQPCYPDSSRPVLHSCSGSLPRPRRQVSECSGTDSKSGHGAHARIVNKGQSLHFSQPREAVSLKHGSRTQ